MPVEAWFKNQLKNCFCFREGVWLLKQSPGGALRVQILSSVGPETQLCQDARRDEAHRKWVPDSMGGYINTEVGVLTWDRGSSLLVNVICDMGYVHPPLPTSAAKLFWWTAKVRHHPQGHLIQVWERPTKALSHHRSSKQNVHDAGQGSKHLLSDFPSFRLHEYPSHVNTVRLQDRL